MTHSRKSTPPQLPPCVHDQRLLVTETPPSLVARLLWLALAGGVFFLLYGLANQHAATLAAGHVGEIVFSWEKNIPFWPWTIIPYWSMDLLFAVSILVCKTRNEMLIQTCRLLLVTLLACLCFYLWPLHFSWDKPPVNGVFGTLFEALGAFDKPFNQAPSLHIALLFVVWQRLLAHLSPRWRMALHLWCALIAASTLTTWQHHFIDLPTGLALGVLVCYLLPMAGRRWKHWQSTDPSRSRRLASRYLTAAIVVALVAITCRDWAWLLLWPACSLLVMALGYGRLGATIFQNDRTGMPSLASLLLLLPYRIGAWISWRFFRQRLAACDWVTTNIAIGMRPAGSLPKQISGRLDLCPELPLHRPDKYGDYTCVPLLDLLPPDSASLQQAVSALDALLTGGPVLVHCSLGLSRSACVVIAWLLWHGDETNLDSAIERLRQVRPAIVLYPSHYKALQDWLKTWR